MFKVPLKILKKLASQPIVEDDNDGSKFFSEFNKQLIAVLNDLKKTKFPTEKHMLYAYKRIQRKFLKKKCPPISFISEGSSRAAYLLSGGLCLKIATCDAGIAQNKAEEHNVCQSSSCEIFPLLYDVGYQHTNLLVECITGCDNTAESSDAFSDFLNFHSWKSDRDYKQPTDVFADVVFEAARELPGDFEAIFEEIGDVSTNAARSELAYMIAHPINAAQRSLSNIARWSLEHLDSIDPIDFGTINNWGFAARNGKIVPIILDAGFSPEVRDKYY